MGRPGMCIQLSGVFFFGISGLSLRSKI
jgi:hypothetical protein